MPLLKANTKAHLRDALAGPYEAADAFTSAPRVPNCKLALSGIAPSCQAIGDSTSSSVFPFSFMKQVTILPLHFHCQIP